MKIVLILSLMFLNAKKPSIKRYLPEIDKDEIKFIYQGPQDQVLTFIEKNLYLQNNSIINWKFMKNFVRILILTFSSNLIFYTKIFKEFDLFVKDVVKNDLIKLDLFFRFINFFKNTKILPITSFLILIFLFVYTSFKKEIDYCQKEAKKIYDNRRLFIENEEGKNK